MRLPGARPRQSVMSRPRRSARSAFWFTEREARDVEDAVPYNGRGWRNRQRLIFYFAPAVGDGVYDVPQYENRTYIVSSIEPRPENPQIFGALNLFFYEILCSTFF